MCIKKDFQLEYFGHRYTDLGVPFFFEKSVYVTKVIFCLFRLFVTTDMFSQATTCIYTNYDDLKV